MEYLVYLADVGMQVFLCFRDDEEVGMQVFQDEMKVRMERLADMGIEVEEDDEEEEVEEVVGNHVRKEPVPYCVNYKESVL
jgi:thioredoxin reductase